MSVIRVVWGTGEGPTELAAYDAALAAAGVHNYNLVTLSSVVPAEPPIEVVGTAPDLGPVGNELRVVESSSTAAPGETAAAGVGWSRSASGRGIFYEVEGEDPDAVRTEVRQGLAAGRELRDWDFQETEVVVEAVAADDEYASAVVCATYGQSRPVLTGARDRPSSERREP